LETGNRLELNLLLKNYKTISGAVNFPAVLSVSKDERIPALINSAGYGKIHGIICAAIQLSMESLNLTNTLNAAQIFDLSDTVIDSANEDYLALQDLVLFLQKLVRGEMGTLYNQMDIAKFMELFENYRQDRHRALLGIREESHAQFKALPIPERFSDMSKDEERSAFHEAMNDYVKQTTPKE
jgi:hypothetical protein